MLLMLTRAFKRINWRLVVAFPIIAGIVHLIATLIAMNDTGNTAYARLSRALPANTMTVAQPVAPGHQPLPFLSSDARYAFCPFETGHGPLKVRALLPDTGWTIGVYQPDGTSAYFAAAQPGRSTTVVLTLIPSDARFMGATPQALGKPDSGLPQLTVAAREGVVVIRAPDNGDAYRRETESVLAQASCTPSAS
jgi:uncharacterized membrane protein